MAKFKINAGETVELNTSVTPEALCEAVERQMTSLDNPGFCVVCGEENEGCEPDARRYRCEFCHNMSVYGAQEILLSIA
jgi:hypothetical protein